MEKHSSAPRLIMHQQQVLDHFSDVFGLQSSTAHPGGRLALKLNQILEYNFTFCEHTAWEAWSKRMFSKLIILIRHLDDVAMI